MALRVKTVEFAAQSLVASVASAATATFAQFTIYIPETTSRTFRSVIMLAGCRDTVTTATSLTAPTLGITLGAAGASTSNVGNPPGNTGESGHYVFERNVTSYFVTNFGAGTSQTCTLTLAVTGPTTINHTAKLIITYEYDDTGLTTAVKTVRIPLESATGALTTTLTQIGTNQIPQLDTFLPETSKTIRSVWFELWYNDQLSGTTADPQLGMQVDSGTEHLTGLHESSLASSCSGWYIWRQDAITTNATHTFSLRSSVVTNGATFNHVAIVMHVTYEYATSSTRVMNSLQLALPPFTYVGATATTDASGAEYSLEIQEPGTITLAQSGALITYSQSGATNPNIRFGGQSFRTYTDTALLYCGASFLTQRVDSGAAGGAGITLARGTNTFSWEAYIGTAANTPAGFGGVLFLNYTSDVAAGGEGTHNATTVWSVQGSQASGTVSTITAAQWINIPETNWYRNQLALVSHNVVGATNTPANAWSISVESLAGELTAGDWEAQCDGSATTESELGYYPLWCPVGHQSPNDWQRYNGDPETTRLAIEGNRRVRVVYTTTCTRPLHWLLTYHAITYSKNNTVQGYGGSGSGLTVVLHDATTHKPLRTFTTGASGAITYVWYDNTDTYYATCREDATHIGRSNNFTFS